MFVMSISGVMRMGIEMATKIEVELRWQGNHLFAGNVPLAVIFKRPGLDLWGVARCVKVHPVPAIASNLHCEKAFREEVELWAMEALGAKPT